jgi:iron complex outermembrane recepter protein
MASYLTAKLLRFALLGSVSSAVFLASVPAFAQDEAADAEEEEGIREIIVTAQKRSESIQDTPLAITALDSQLLEQSGIKDAQGLTAVVPNVAVRPFNNSIIVATRGISNENTSNLGDASLAFHVNGVYVGRPRAASALFYDLERVELLRGPQGTLYGRNSTAGALNVITKRPDISAIAGGADVSYGNYDAVTARGYINLPLSESIALRASAYYAKHDGYAINNRAVPAIPLLVGPPPAVAGPNALITATNAANLNIPNIKSGDDDNEIAGRLSLLIRPSDSFNWVITGQYQKTDEIGQVRSIINTPQYFAVGGPGVGRLFLPQQQDPSNPRIYSLNTQPSWKVETWDITSEMTYGLSESIDLTMVTGYRKDKSSIRVDAAGSENLSVVQSPGKAKQFSNELRLSSNGEGPFKWLLGAYYFDEDQDDSVFINNVGGGPLNVVGANTYISSSSLAFFGQATYSLTDALRVTAGGRYTDDKKKRFGFTVAAPGITVAPNPLPPGTSYTNNQSWNQFNWKVGVDYDIAPNALLYASYSTGYRAGGFNNSSELAYDPEDIKAFEAGLKTDLLDRRLRFNLAAFHYDYQDLQVTSPRELNGRIQAFTQNAASAKIWGFEIESIIRPSDNFSVDIAFGYLNTKFGDFLSIDNICTAAGLTVPPQFLPGCVTRQRFNPNGTPVLLPVSPAPGAPLGPVFDLQQVNYRGNRLANAPEVTVNVGANWTLFDNDAGSFTLRGALRLVGESYLSEYNRSPDRVASYAMSEVRATYRSADKSFLVEAFAQNIGNKTVPASISVTASGFGAAYLPPRTYGVRVGFDF